MTDGANALLSYDFENVFPHKTWVSTWATDASHPEGFRYKVMSANHVVEKSIELLIVLQHRNGSKDVLKHYDVEPSGFDRVAATFVDGLAEQHGISFEEQDFRSCQNPEQFESAAARFGWLSEPMPSNTSFERTREG
jgi:hypothetical protein